MDKKQFVYNAISELHNINDARSGKYRRNFRRYNYTPFASIENMKNPSVIGYWQLDQSPEDDTTPTPELNIIKSCIDTLTSKISQSKVRPFFNTQNGSFKDIQIVKQAQAFFDLYYDMQRVNHKVSMAFKDCCIFDTGVIYVDEVEKTINKALPYQVYIRPAEKTYGKLTRVYYERKDYPVSLLPESEAKLKDVEGLDYVTYGLYYDTVNEIKAYVVNGIITRIETYKSGVIPFVFMHYCDPIHGTSSQSVVDMLNSIQLEIDTIMAKINDASQLNPANTYFVPEQSDIKVSQLSDRTGNVIKYKATPNMTGSPVTVATPAFIDGQYIALLNELKQSAYELVGISQLSAMSAKPTGLDSGIALSTMENIESDRFETQLNQVVQSYVEIAKICIAVFPEEESILPEANNHISVTWRDIVEESKKMIIQFSAADSLSKDPSVKLQQLQQLAMSGIIPAERIAQFMELPDIQSGYGMANNAVNAVLTVINDCIDNDNFVIPDFIPFTMLKKEIINTQLSLKAAASKDNDNIHDIAKLQKLYDRCEIKEKEWQSAMAPVAPEQSQQLGEEEQQLPQAGNVLDQEAGMTRVEGPDMDVATPTGSAANGGWNQQYTR